MTLRGDRNILITRYMTLLTLVISQSHTLHTQDLDRRWDETEIICFKSVLDDHWVAAGWWVVGGSLREIQIFLQILVFVIALLARSLLILAES